MKSNAPHRSVNLSSSALPTWRAAVLLTAVAASSSLVSYGQFIVNPNFAGSGTGGFSPGWSTGGDAAVKTPTFNGGSNPASGLPFEAVMTTITIDSPPISGTPAFSSGSALETFLGLAPGTLSNQGRGTATEGSGITQTFSAQAGDSFTFKWNFYTSERSDALSSLDYAFFTLHQATPSSSVTVLADPTSGLHVAPLGLLSQFSFEKGYTTSSTITIPSTGTWTLGFGVVENNVNPGTDSALAVTGIAFTPVPEPWAWSLATGLGLGGLALGRRLRRSSEAQI